MIYVKMVMRFLSANNGDLLATIGVGFRNEAGPFFVGDIFLELV